MSSLRPTTKAKIDAAIASGVDPHAATRGAQQSLFLRAPGTKRPFALLDAQGELRPAGRYYFQKLAKDPPASGFDKNQEPVLEGKRFTIRTRRGETKTVREWRGDRWHVTALGKQFYKNRTARYIVDLPARARYTHEGRYQSWDEDEFLSSTAVDGLGVLQAPAAMDEEAQKEEILRQISDWVAAQTPTPHGVLLLSDAYADFFLKDSWRTEARVSKEEVVFSASGDAAVKATMERPLRGAAYLSCALRFPHAALPEAFESTEEGTGVSNCVVRQLSLATGVPAESLAEEVESLWAQDPSYESEFGRTHWSHVGVTSEIVRRLCSSLGVSLHIFHRNGVLNFRAPSAKGRPVAYEIWGDHAYFLDSALLTRKLAKLKDSCPQTSSSDAVQPMVAKRFKRADGGIADWEALPVNLEKIEPGATYAVPAPSLPGVREALLGRGVIPNCRLGGPNLRKDILELSVPTKAEAAASIRPVPTDAPACRAFCEKYLSRPYRGEPKHVLTQWLLERLARQGRALCAQTLRDSLLGAPCAMCGSELTAHVDHKIPLSQGGSNSDENLQGLCPECHSAKTLAEARCPLDDDFFLQSRLNRETYEHFHMSKPPPQAVAFLKTPTYSQALNIDVVRCRRNALLSTETPLPVLCATDFIQPRFGHTLGALNYIGEIAVRSSLRAFPYHGAAWYTLAATRFLMEVGVVAWTDVLYTLDAQVSFDPSRLKDLFEEVEAAWEEVSPGSAKVAVNAMFGLWARRERKRYRLWTVADEADVPQQGLRSKVSNGDLQDVVTEGRVLTYASLRSVHQHCLDGERLLLARALQAVTRASSLYNVLSLETDGLYLQLTSAGQAKKIEELLDPRAYRTTVHPEGPPRLVSGGSLKIEHSAKPVLAKPLWRDLVEDHPQWREEVALPALMQSGGLVLGPPGVGKTHLLRSLRDALRARGATVHCVALTHVAARNIGGDAQTLHRWLHTHSLHGTFSGTLLVDELSQLSVELANALEHVTLGGARIIGFGDWDQLPPVCPTFRGQSVSATSLRDSRLPFLWANGTRLTLRRCFRTSDPAFFAWYSSLPSCPSLAQAVAHALAAYPPTSEPDWCIVLSHARRKRISLATQARFVAGKDSQSVGPYRLCVGTPLLGKNGNKKGIVNGARLAVTALTASHATVKDEVTGAQTTLKLAEVPRCARLRWAMTYASCQGATLPGVVRLHDVRSPFFTKTHLYMGAARCTEGCKLQVVE